MRLEQIGYNLLQNAIKYSPDGGTIHVVLATAATQHTLQVSESGVGIPTEDLAQIFERFYRASNVTSTTISGMEVGLYLVNELITRHEGTINVACAVGQGSTFTITLPVYRPETDQRAP